MLVHVWWWSFLECFSTEWLCRGAIVRQKCAEPAIFSSSHILLPVSLPCVQPNIHWYNFTIWRRSEIIRKSGCPHQSRSPYVSSFIPPPDSRLWAPHLFPCFAGQSECTCHPGLSAAETSVKWRQFTGTGQGHLKLCRLDPDAREIIFLVHFFDNSSGFVGQLGHQASILIILIMMTIVRSIPDWPAPWCRCPQLSAEESRHW